MTEKLGAQLGRSPSVAELAEALGATEEQTLDALEAYHARHAAPLDHGPEDDDDAPSGPRRFSAPWTSDSSRPST